MINVLKIEKFAIKVLFVANIRVCGEDLKQAVASKNFTQRQLQHFAPQKSRCSSCYNFRAVCAIAVHYICLFNNVIKKMRIYLDSLNPINTLTMKDMSPINLYSGKGDFHQHLSD
jgi:hypothetical protein